MKKPKPGRSKLPARIRMEYEKEFAKRTENEFGQERPGDPMPLVSAVMMNDIHTTHTALTDIPRNAFTSD